MPVTRHLVRPTQGSNEARRLLPFYLVLHRVGFTELPPSPAALVSSYLTFSPLPSAVTRGFGGFFSVALSLESLPLGVTQHPAPWSSDFPQAPGGARNRLSCSTLFSDKTYYVPDHPATHPTGLRLAIEFIVRQFIRDLVILARDMHDLDSIKIPYEKRGTAVKRL